MSNSDAREARAELVERARVQVRAIGQLYHDTERWNRAHPDQQPIDVDPDGELARIRHRLHDMLDRESTQRGQARDGA